MKKIMIFAAFAAALSLASCQQEGLNEVVKNDPSAVSESPVFTGTINAGTKTTVDAASGKVSWETTDEITVTDKDQKTAVYSIESIDGTTGRATFVYKSGDTLGECPYTATYGTAPTTAQTYSATPGKLYMTATATSGTSLEFTVQCGLMEINLTKAGESVKSIAVTGTPTGGSETTYTMTCTDAQSIAEKTAFYISVAAGSYNKIVITDNNDKVCTLTAASGITVANNHIKPLTFGADKLNFKSNLPAGALPGVFSVSDTTKVYFSQGNLRFLPKDRIWRFADNQYDILSDNGPTSYYTESSTSWIDLFGWGTSGYNHRASCFQPWSTGTYDADYYAYGDSNCNLSDGDGRADWGYNKITNGGDSENLGWRTLSSEEWQYLLGEKSDLRKGKCRIVRFNDATTTLFFGLVIAPDDFVGEISNSYTIDKWKDAESSSNLVLLPAVGRRRATTLEGVIYEGYYWSSTHNSIALYANVLYFSSSSIYPEQDYERSNGHSVRLVLDVK